MNITLNNTTDRERRIPGSGNYLYVQEATGPVLIIVTLKSGSRQEIEFRARNQMRFDEDINELELVNLVAGSNVIEVVTGYGEFLPDNDGQRVTLTGQDLAIEIQTPAGQPIAVESTNAKPVVVVNQTGNDLSVTVADKGQAAMAASVPVVLASDQTAVAVSGPLTNAELLAATVDVQQVVYGTNTPGNKITGSGTIPGNATRKYVVIKPLRGNTGIGWLSTNPNEGVALEGGDAALVLETTAAINISATAGTDVYTWTEIEV